MAIYDLELTLDASIVIMPLMRPNPTTEGVEVLSALKITGISIPVK